VFADNEEHARSPYRAEYKYAYIFYKEEEEEEEEIEVDLFNCPNPSSRTMALGSIQPLTEMSTRNLPRG
jgi:DNA primase catalytic subunit